MRSQSDKFSPTPRCWNHIYRLAKKLTKDIPALRIDFYDLNFENRSCEENVILSEMTFRSHGTESFRTAIVPAPEFDNLHGLEGAYYLFEKYPCESLGLTLEKSSFHWKLVILDLDDTIWKGDVQWMEKDKMKYDHGKEYVHDGNMNVDIFMAVKPFMKCLRKNFGTQFGIASHGPKPTTSMRALELLDISFPSTNLNIFQTATNPSSKMYHFDRMQLNSGLQFEDMLFIDNVAKYVNEAQSLGISAIHAPQGLQTQTVQEILRLIKSYSNS